MIKQLQMEFNAETAHIKNIITLIDEGNTIPFIARYRKELTGSMDDQVLRALADRLIYLRNLEEKRLTFMETVREQEKLTAELEKDFLAASTLTELEDLYRPFRPKRRTRATMAMEKGLLPLAEIIWGQALEEPIENIAMAYVDMEKDLETVEDAISGALDILAEQMSDDADNRSDIRDIFMKKGQIVTEKAEADETTSIFSMYFDFREPVKNMAGHRVLAINRGEKEKELKVSIQVPEAEIIEKMNQRFIVDNPFTKNKLMETVTDSYKRLIEPSIERDIRNTLSDMAETGALEIFSENLRQLLLQPTMQDKVVLALDPAFRTGCKVAVIDSMSRVLDTTIVFPTAPRNDIQGSIKVILPMLIKHEVDIIAIGNGTASRETEIFVSNMLKDNKEKLNKEIHYIIVNEAGASVYSASKLAASEFPNYDVGLRSAVSIARRLQDPLAELVKIDPKSIGVGQYQHDMNQKRLDEMLAGVVESAVNMVGVDLNTASPSLLSYVAGISPAVASNILESRETNGAFKSRNELKKVKRLGPKAFEQCAGFLRVPHSKNPLDNTGVHPESYEVTKQLLTHIGASLDELREPVDRKRFGNLSDMAIALQVGLPTLEDIVTELEKPGRDPRDGKDAPLLRVDVLEIEDLEEGMIVAGTVRNITDFGAFVDIGVHQDGLVHISELADKFIKHPLDIVSVGDIVDTRVLAVDLKRGRISLSMRKERP